MSRKNTLSQVTDFDIRLLRLFGTVSECGSFAAAESVLGISRSAISQHMADLEKRLGMRLCERGRSGFALTNEGHGVLQASHGLLLAIEGFRSEVNQLHLQLRGELNIGIINNLVTQSRMRITQSLKALKEDGPGVRINIGMMTPSDIEKSVLDGQLHVGVVPLIQPVPGLEYLPLYEERSLLYCSNEHPLYARGDDALSPAALAQADAVAPGFRLPAQAMERQQTLGNSATASDREGIAFLILTGRYIGFLPDHYAAAWVERGMMKPLLPAQYWYDISLNVVTRKGRKPNLVLERFMQRLADEPE